MATTITGSVQELVENNIPRIRGNASDREWEQNLFKQVDAMVGRLEADKPIDIREGLKEGVVVFSIYELLISAGKERTDAGADRLQLVAA